jgi:chorismate mutase
MVSALVMIWKLVIIGRGFTKTYSKPGAPPSMQNNPVPEELLKLRQDIDEIDQELLRILAKRFLVTNQVGRLKAAHGLQSVDPVREREKLEGLVTEAAGLDLDQTFVASLFRMIFDEVVKNHRYFLDQAQA